MKKIISILLALVLLVGTTFTAAVTVSAEEYECDGFTYYFDEDLWGMVITGYTGYYSSVEIPEEMYCYNEYYDDYDDYRVVAIDSEAFKGKTSLTSFTLPDTLEEIGEDAFYNTGYYKNSSNWENNLLYVDDCLVAAKSGITDCVIKEGTRLIAKYVFTDDVGEGIETVTVPSGLELVCGGAFGECYDVEEVYCESWEDWLSIRFDNIGSNPLYAGSAKLYVNNQLVTTINDQTFPILEDDDDDEAYAYVPRYTFAGCSSITSVDLEIVYIEYGAFATCENLKSFNSDYCYISDYAFAYCNKLEDINIAKVDYIGEYAFGDTAYYNDQSNWEDGILYLNTYLIAADTNSANVRIKDGTTNIAAYAFEWNDDIESVTIPASVVNIGEYAFYQCENLKNVYATSYDNWVDIYFDGAYANPLNNGANLYFNNQKVTTLNINADVNSNAFYGCQSITTLNVTLNEDTYISSSTFEECNNIVTLNLIKGDTNIISQEEGAYFISNLKSLKTINVGKGFTDIGEWAFDDLYNLENATLPTTLKTIGWGAFSCDESLKKIVIPQGVTDIDKWAFENCYSLTEVTIPKTLKNLGGSAFNYCEAIEKVYIDDLVSWCNLNKSLKNDGETYLGDSPMDYGAKLYIAGKLAEDIVIPAGIKKIKPHTFYGCESMKSLTIPQGVVEIEEWAFTECINLNYINMPSSVVEIADNAFNRCFSVKHMNYEGTKSRWGSISDYRYFEDDGATVHYSSTGKIQKVVTTSGCKGSSLSYYTCTCCGGRFDVVNVPKAHKIVTTTKKATLAAAGSVTSKCSICGVTTAKRVLPKLVPKGTKVSKLTAAKKSLKVKIKREKSVSGYQIQYSLKKNFKGAKTVTLKKNSLTSKTINKLKAKKTYYVRIRTYKTYKGKKYYSAWSKAVKKKTK